MLTVTWPNDARGRSVSGYMPLSGTASGRPLMINSVSRRRHRQILLATFSRPQTAFPQLMSPFQATRRRNLRLATVSNGQPRLLRSIKVPSSAALTPAHLTPSKLVLAASLPIHLRRG